MPTHAQLATDFLTNKEYAAFHNNSLWFVREKRDKMSHSLKEWETLRENASQIKAHTLSQLADYLELFEKNATANGIRVHWARTGEEHNQIVLNILQKHKARKVVKSKSMLTEECHLNPYLEQHEIAVIDTDLGERIIQLQHSRPSHIVMPAIHLKRQTIGKLFEKYLDTEKDNADPTYLTQAARRHLREKFLDADVAMTGVNFAIAESGAIVVCTNEGNADMGVSLAKVHIASMGIEKVIPDLRSLSVFTRLLARSATGQPVTTYTSHFQKPMEGGELHVILVDNGRSEAIHNVNHRNALKCIRCAACMNTCPVYRRSGGYSYSYFIPGPIGINLGLLSNQKTYRDNAAACSLCFSCSDVCPVKIDLAEQIYKGRQSLGTARLIPKSKKILSRILQIVMERKFLFHSLSKLGYYTRFMPRFLRYNGWNKWGKDRELPPIPKHSFHSLWKKGKIS